jgi:hypothetical protein
MAILPQNLDYTDKDFDSIRARVNNLIDTVFPDWTDKQRSNFGNVLLDSFAYVGDILAFYQDNQAKESRLTDVELRTNALKLADQLGFDPSGATAATAEVLVRLAAVPTNDVVFPDETTVRTADVSDPVEFQFLGSLTIPAATDPPEAFVTVENSSNFDEEFQSDGLADQKFTLSGTPFLDGSLVIFAQNGEYTVVDNFLDSSSTDRDVTVEADENDRATITFGDGTNNGAIPVGLISVSYKTGGGTVGNVEANTITRIPGSFTDVLGGSVDVAVNNPVKASGGSERMNVEEIKLRAPQSVRVSDRTVALEDYQIGAEAVPGVARALMLTSDQTSGIPENRGFLYVIPDGGGIPSQALKDAVLEAVTVTKPNTITFKVEVKDPIYTTIDIGATVYKSSGASADVAAESVRSNLTKFFQITNDDGTPNENIGFGFSGKQADGSPAREISLIGPVLTGIIEDNLGVRKIGDRDQDYTINGSHEDATLELFEFPILGTVTLLDGDTGESI